MPAGRSSRQSSSSCVSGVMSGFATCFRKGAQACSDICRGAVAKKVGPVGPAIREHVLARPLTPRSAQKTIDENAVDIHALLVAPDPTRRVSKSYQTIGMIGKGGFGSVYRVQYLPTGEMRAIKMLQTPKDEKHAQRVLTEVELLIELDHPSIEKFYEFFENKSSICVVTELCTGGHMGHLDAEDHAEEIRPLYRDVVSAVAYCHSKGVAHRDLKFENCLLTEAEGAHVRRIAKVIDFGLSAVRPMDEHSERWMHEAVGTLYFVAPEVVQSDSGWKQHTYGSRCDLWSIGVMLFITLTDQHPYTRSACGTNEMLHCIRKEPLRMRPMDDAMLDPTTRGFLMALLKKDPEKRPTADEALAHTFFTMSSNSLPISEETPKTSPQAMNTIFSRVCSFSHFSRFERAILTLVAHDAQTREVEDLRAAFVSLDAASAGWLSRQGIRTALRNKGIVISEEELQSALDALDPDGDDQIQYTDWLAATLKPGALTSQKAIREVFGFFDTHGTGKVSKANIVEVLGKDVELPPDMQLDKGQSLDLKQFEAVMLHVSQTLLKREIRHHCTSPLLQHSSSAPSGIAQEHDHWWMRGHSV